MVLRKGFGYSFIYLLYNVWIAGGLRTLNPALTLQDNYMSNLSDIPQALQKPIPSLNVGDKVFMLTILEIIPGSYPYGMKKVSGGHKHKRVRALCECGVERVLYYDSVRWHKTKSCGCLRNRIGQTHGMHKSAEYRSWDGMKRRCYNKNSKDYKYYGPRGIIVCDRWINNFEAFFEDMGLKPSAKHSIDRINNDGNYEPGNCRWATAQQQSINRRPSARIYKKNNLEV